MFELLQRFCWKRLFKKTYVNIYMTIQARPCRLLLFYFIATLICFIFFKDIYPGLKAVLILSGFWTDFIGFTNRDRSNPASSLTRLSRTQTLRSQRQSHHTLSTCNSKWHWSPRQSSLHINAIWTEIQDLQTEESSLQREFCLLCHSGIEQTACCRWQCCVLGCTNVFMETLCVCCCLLLSVLNRLWKQISFWCQ